MKKIIILLILVLTTMVSFAQTQIKRPSSDSTQKKQNNGAFAYRLFSTQNMWTFIKLNTRNGQMWQVQYDVKENNRFEVYLNVIPLVDKEKEANDRFMLYPTQNIYTFLLLDQLDGRIWQVQWSTEVEGRLVLPIE